ncbi:MAG: Rdx family protein [Desulfobulbaceae bacterium]|nr:Rdx family protein [Desulfobulbaceae bacterium]
MEDAIRKEIDAEVDLVAGSGGIFLVSVDDREIFSKKKEGRFPEVSEIMAKLN